MRIGWRKLDWDAPRQERCLHALTDQSFHTYTHPLAVLENHPETRHAIVDYREVVEDPETAVGEVYRQLGLSMGDAYLETLKAESLRGRKHVSGHAYSLDEFGLDADEIRRRLADLFERFDWESGAGEASGPEPE